MSGPRRLAVYPGSFDPLHNGHVDIIDRCLPIFDDLLVAVLRNEEKQPLFSVDERVEILHQTLAGRARVRVESFSGLLVDFMDRVGAITIVRGLRALSDFDLAIRTASPTVIVERLTAPGWILPSIAELPAQGILRNFTAC